MKVRRRIRLWSDGAFLQPVMKTAFRVSDCGGNFIHAPGPVEPWVFIVMKTGHHVRQRPLCLFSRHRFVTAVRMQQSPYFETRIGQGNGNRVVARPYQRHVQVLMLVHVKDCPHDRIIFSFMLQTRFHYCVWRARTLLDADQYHARVLCHLRKIIFDIEPLSDFPLTVDKNSQFPLPARSRLSAFA